MNAQGQINITLTKEQQKRVIQLAEKRKSSHEIARIIGVSHMKTWRNMKLMGINANKFPHMSGENKQKQQNVKEQCNDEAEFYNCDSEAFAF